MFPFFHHCCFFSSTAAALEGWAAMVQQQRFKLKPSWQPRTVLLGVSERSCACVYPTAVGTEESDATLALFFWLSLLCYSICACLCICAGITLLP